DRGIVAPPGPSRAPTGSAPATTAGRSAVRRSTWNDALSLPAAATVAWCRPAAGRGRSGRSVVAEPNATANGAPAGTPTVSARAAAAAAARIVPGDASPVRPP